MKIKKRFSNAIALVKTSATGAGVGGILGAYFHSKQNKSYSKKEHLLFLIRLDQTTQLVQQIIADAYVRVKENGGPVSFDLEEMQTYQQTAKQIWSAEISFVDPSDINDDEPMIH